jgi:amino acid transporter
MPPRARKIALGIAAAVLLSLLLWFADLAMAQWFFADFHNASAKVHAGWGNQFALLALLLLIAFLYTLRLLHKK